MWLSNHHNSDVHRERVNNKGVLKVQYEPAEELETTTVDIQTGINDLMDESEFPCALNFLPADTFREVMEQKPPTMEEVSVIFPLQPDCQRLEEMVTVDKMKLFMARPPSTSVSYSDLTPVQQWAVDLGVSKHHQILYLCGKAGSGKTEVALHICERMYGRVQAGAGTGKAASNFNGDCYCQCYITPVCIKVC